MKTIDEIVQELLQEGEWELSYITEDDEIEINDEKVDVEEVNKFVEFHNRVYKGRKRNKEIKVRLTETEDLLFKDKVKQDNTTIQKLLHNFIINYIME